MPHRGIWHTSFDGDGRAVVDLGGIDSVNAAVEQPDGKIVVAGASDGDFALARFQPNGRLDTSFGTGGIALTDFGGSDDFAHALTIAPDGRFVAAGLAGSTAASDFALARYGANGALEATFVGSFATFEGANESARAVGVAPDGGIFIAGGVNFETSNADADCWGVAKLTPAFEFDTSFSGDGKLTDCLLGDLATALAALGDGSVIVIGRDNSDDFAIEKFSAAGEPQVSFGGSTDFSNGSVDNPRALAVQEDGKIVVVGQALTQSGPTMVAARYDAGDGTLDETFFTNGFRAIFFGESFGGDARAVAVQPDGKIIVGGFVGNSAAIAIARLHTTGDLDTTFSGDGRLITFFQGASATANALLLQRSSGRIVTAGSLITRNADGDVVNSDAVLTRYHAISCNNRDVTRIGTNGPETIFGAIIRSGPSVSPVADVLHAFGGNDTINAGGNNDTVCGGTGRDTVNGGIGNDTLLGQDGSDSLDGGDGTDTCSGGGFAVPADTFQNCETVNTGKSGFSGEWLDVSQHCNRSGENPQCRVIGILEVENPGTETTAVPAIAAVYLSFDDQLDEGDVFLTNIDIPVLEPGETHVLRLNLKVSDFDDLSDLQVIAVLDVGDVVPEVNEENNTVVSEPLR